MPAERFFIDAELKLGKTVSLEETELHHLAHVMKVQIGEEVELVDGRGNLAQAKLIGLTKHRATLDVLSVFHKPLVPPAIILALPILRPSKLELILEKGTELGADAFWLYPAVHSEKNNLSEHQLERLRYITISAMKQCGRLDLPHLEIVSDLNGLFMHQGTFLFGDTRKEAPPIEAVARSPVIFISGPERGFTKEEVELLEKKAKGITLHPNILRAETAPLAALVQLYRVMI